MYYVSDFDFDFENSDLYFVDIDSLVRYKFEQ